MKKQWFYLMGLFIVMPFFSRAQICTWTDSTAFLPETNASYICSYPLESYIPDITDSIITLNVCLIIGQDQNGNSAFADNRILDSTDFANALIWLNDSNFNNLPAPNVPNPNAAFNVVDTRIRFRLARVWYVKADSSGLNATDNLLSNVPPDVARHRLLIGYTSNAFKGVNVSNVLPHGKGSQLNHSVFMYEHPSFWGLNLLAHELGHALGLAHTHVGSGGSSVEVWSDGDQLDDTPPDMVAFSDTACYPLAPGCGCPPQTPYPGNVCPDNFMSYHDQQWWSPKQVGRMRKEIFEDFLDGHYVTEEDMETKGFIEITNNTNWTGYRPLQKNLRIKAGATLTLHDAFIVMGKNAKIEVEPNARLVMNCSRLTSYYSFWSGIHLLGDNTARQINQYQGELVMNRSQIEFATDAIYNGTYHNCYVVPSGGMIKVDSSSFINNLRDVALVKYEPSQAWGHWLADWVDYKASFSYSRFIKNTECLSNEYYRGASVSLWGVHGVAFDNCSFTLGSYEVQAHPLSPGEAVFMLDGSARITNSFFNFFNYGIKSLATKPTLKGSLISHSNFSYHRSGMYLSGSRNSKIFKNQFTIPKDIPGTSVYGVDVPYGLYLDQAGSFTTESNVFAYFGLTSRNYSNDPSATHIGLVVNNNSDYSDVLYQNRFATKIGIEALGQNRDQNGWNGLQFRCNEFTAASKTNIYVKGTLNNSLDGIRRDQGDLVTPALHENMAGNLFSSDTTNHLWDFNNENTPQVNYHHHNKNSSPSVEPIPRQGVLPFNNNLAYNSNACPTRLIVQPESGDTLPELDYPLAQAETDFEQHTAEADSLEVVLHQLVDGGNTYALQGEIYFTPQHEHFELYSSLIDESPYLSDAVLTDIIELDGFDELMLRNILVANPQSAKNQQLMDLLGEEHPDMPRYMIDDIKTGQDNFGAMELVEGDLAYHRQRQHFAAKRLLDLYVNDENHFSEAEEAVRHLLRQLRTPSFQYMRAQMELELGNITEARQVIDSVPLLCALQDDEALVHARAESYFDLQFDRAGNEQAVCDYSPAQLQNLQNLSAGDHIAGAWSRATLELLGQAVTYQEPLYLPGTASGKRAESHQFPQVARPLNRLYPNPARKQVSVGLGEIPLARKVEVQLFDLSGRQVKSQPMAGAETQVSLKGIAPGTYLLGVYADGNRIFEDKLIILE